MKITTAQNRLWAEGSGFAVSADASGISVRMEGEEIVLLRPESSVDPLRNGIPVDDLPLGSLTFSCREEPDGCTALWTGASSAWERKEYRLRIREDRAEYTVKVFGNAHVDAVRYFIGDPSSPCPGSDYEFDTGYTPIPTVDGAKQCTFSPEYSYNEFSYLTVPPLFCYVFDVCGISTRLAMGLKAGRGEHCFTSFGYGAAANRDLWKNRFWMTVDPAGHAVAEGEWVSPAIVLYPVKSRQEAFERYSELYFEDGTARRSSNLVKPRVWYGPIACGWVEQAARVAMDKLPMSIQDAARQPVYDEFLRRMDARGLHPKLLIIDDKWQTEYGTAVPNPEKWPDLKGWIERVYRERDCRTMLWFKLWDAEGLPESMTMPDGKGGRSADPSNPEYRAFLKERLHALLSEDEGCAGAQGLKLDYGFCQPMGREAVSFSGQYGAELLLEYIRFIHETAHSIRPDAIISASPCHPIFSGYVDHARLHDYYQDLRRAPEEFAFRRDIYRAALPDALFDTDGSGFSSKRDTLRHLLTAPELGIPDLYCVSPTPALSLSDSDWKMVSEAWKNYELKTDLMLRNAEKAPEAEL